MGAFSFEIPFLVLQDCVKFHGVHDTGGIGSLVFYWEDGALLDGAWHFDTRPRAFRSRTSILTFGTSKYYKRIVTL